MFHPSTDPPAGPPASSRPPAEPPAGLTAVRVGVLLAGGESRRMGVDKRTLRLAGDTLLQRNLAFLNGLFPAVALSVRDAGLVPEGLPAGVVVVPDEVPGSPLGGLASVLSHFGEPVFAMAADLVTPDPAAVRRVLRAFRDADVALPVAEGHLEPLHAVYGPGCLPHMRALLAADRHSILDLLPLVRVARVRFTDAAPFFNVNTPADWMEARRRLDDRIRAEESLGDESAFAEPAATGAPAVQTAAPEPAAASTQQKPTAGAARGAGAAGLPAVLGVVGRPNSGKTTLIERLIPEFTRRGLRVGAVKRVATFEIDHPGKDSWRHGQTGADAYTVASASKLAFVSRSDEEESLDRIVARFFTGFDLVIGEGYRREAPDVIEVFRSGAGYEIPVCDPGEPLALVTDTGLEHPHRFGLDEVAALAAFVLERLGVTTQD